MRDKNTVIFDLDGVIFDSERAWLECWKEVAAAWGLDRVEEVFRKCIGTNDNQTHMIVEEAYAPEYGEGIADKLLSENSGKFHEKYHDKPLPLKAGVRELLQTLYSGDVLLGVASSTNKATVEAELETAGLKNFFYKITGGDSVVISKPDPQIYYIACSEMGVEPAKTFAVEDSYNGIRAAYAAGMKPIMVPDIIPADDEMRRLSVIVCNDLFEVMDHLDSLWNIKRR